MNPLFLLRDDKLEKLVSLHLHIEQQVVLGRLALEVIVEPPLEFRIHPVHLVTALAVRITIRRVSVLVLINVSLEHVQKCGAVDVVFVRLVDEVLQTISDFFGLFVCALFALAGGFFILELIMKVVALAFDVFDGVFEVFEYLLKTLRVIHIFYFVSGHSDLFLDRS